MNTIELLQKMKDEKIEKSIYSEIVGISNQLEKISTQEKRSQIISAIMEYLHEKFEPIDA